MAKCNKDIAETTKKCTVLLLDIEGTTTSISFVKDKLFPYSAENVEKFLESHWDKEDVKKAVADLRKQAVDDVENKVEDVVPVPAEDASKEDQIVGLVKNVKWQISIDRKAGPLKFLQGLIWKQGYENGDIKGHVYEDVAPALVQWRSVDDKKVYIYSSGSVQAQKLIFGQSEAGDLTKHIDGYFDTEVGAKQEANSYKNIVEKVGVKADEILFLTDIPKEATAATEAGLNCALLDRPGNASLADEDKLTFPVLTSLAELAPSQKRKPDEQEEVQPAKVAKTEAESDVKKEVDIAETSPSKEVKEDIPAPKEAQTIPKEEVESMEVSEAPVEEEVIKTADAKTDNDKEKDQESMETDSAVTEVEIKEVSDVEKIVEEVVNLTPVVEEPAMSEKVEDVKTDKVENKGEEKADVVPEKVDIEIANEADKDVEMQVEKAAPAIIIEEVKAEDKPSCSVIDKLDITDAEPVVEEPVEECAPETTEYIDLMRTEGWPAPVEEDQVAECDEIIAKVDDILTDAKDSKVKNVEKVTEKVESPAEVKKEDKAESPAEDKKEDKTEAQTLETTKEETVVASSLEEKVITVESEKPNEDIEIADVVLEKEVESKEETGDITEKHEMDDVVEQAEEQVEEKEDRTKTSKTNEKDKESKEDTMEVEKSKEDTVEVKVKEITTEKDPTPPILEPNSEKMEEDEKVTEQIESPVDIVKENGSNEPEKTNESAEDRLETNGVDKPLNGESATKSLNGDAQVNGEDAESRVSEESHDKEERLNGTNGAKAAEEESTETEVAEIKVKSIPVDETSVPIEQATEA